MYESDCCFVFNAQQLFNSWDGPVCVGRLDELSYSNWEEKPTTILYLWCISMLWCGHFSDNNVLTIQRVRGHLAYFFLYSVY